MPQPTLKKILAALLAGAMLMGTAPAASASAGTYPDYARSDPDVWISDWDENVFLDGGQYWETDDYWGGDFYYRGSYDWPADLGDIYLDAPWGITATIFTSPNVNRDGMVDQIEAGRQLSYAAARSTDGYATLRVINGEILDAATLRTLVSDARGQGGKTALVCAYTMLPSQERHQTRLYFEPGKMAASGEDIRLGVYSDNEWIYREKQEYLDEFSNYLQLIRFAQSDEFPATVQVYAQIDLSKLDTRALRFYSVNRITGAVTEITNPQYSFADNDKLTFHTRLAGDILITDRTLATKKKSNGWISEERIAAGEPGAIAQRAAEAAQKAADLAAQAAAIAAAAVPGTTDAQAKQAAADAAQTAAESAAQAAADAAAAAAAVTP